MESRVFEGLGEFWLNFRVEADVPSSHFCTERYKIPYNVVDNGFHIIKLCSRLSSREVQF